MVRHIGNVITGGDMMPKVKCSVANCVYWEEGNNCAAEMIFIDIDRHGDEVYDGEFAVEDFVNHQDTATISSSTCCHTFEPRADR